MTVKPLPLKKDEEEKLEKFINKGAPVCADVKEESNRTILTLRIPTEFLKKIDEKVKTRVGMSRSAWILEAMQKHLEKE